MSIGTNPARIVQVAVGIVVDKVSIDANSAHHDHDRPAPLVPDPQPPRILITRRKADQVLAGYWELPGGKLEPDESPADAVVRELLEEVGIEVAPVAALPPVEHRYDHAHVRLSPFICRHLAGTPRPLHADELRWVRPEALSGYAFPDASLPILDELIRWLDNNP